MVFSVGAVQVSVADPVPGGGGAGAVTSIVNGPIEAVDPLSLAVMVIAPVVPSSALVGLPLNAPVVTLNVAQAGIPVIENVTVPLLSVAVGWNE